MYNDFECHTPKLSTFLAIYPSAGAPVFQSASFTRAPVCQSASLPECQFAKVPVRTGGKIVLADQIYRGRFLFASKNCENNKNTDFATLFLVLQQRKSKRKLADVNFNKR
jgi:hypothetical protein